VVYTWTLTGFRDAGDTGKATMATGWRFDGVQWLTFWVTALATAWCFYWANELVPGPIYGLTTAHYQILSEVVPLAGIALIAGRGLWRRSRSRRLV